MRCTIFQLVSIALLGLIWLLLLVASAVYFDMSPPSLGDAWKMQWVNFAGFVLAFVLLRALFGNSSEISAYCKKSRPLLLMWFLLAIKILIFVFSLIIDWGGNVTAAFIAFKHLIISDAKTMYSADGMRFLGGVFRHLIGFSGVWAALPYFLVAPIDHTKPWKYFYLFVPDLVSNMAYFVAWFNYSGGNIEILYSLVSTLTLLWLYWKFIMLNYRLKKVSINILSFVPKPAQFLLAVVSVPVGLYCAISFVLFF